MAENKKQEKSGKSDKDKDKDKDKKGMREQVQTYVSLVRILQTDIPGNKNTLTGLTYIKGVSWTFSNAICKAQPTARRANGSSSTTNIRMGGFVIRSDLTLDLHKSSSKSTPAVTVTSVEGVVFLGFSRSFRSSPWSAALN